MKSAFDQPRALTFIAADFVQSKRASQALSSSPAFPELLTAVAALVEI